MRNNQSIRLIILTAVLALSISESSQADLIGSWDFETVNNGTTVVNGGVGGTAAGWGTLGDGTVNGTVSFVYDDKRQSNVAQFTGAGCISLGTLPELSGTTTDFTFSFWGKNTGTGLTDVVFGNRFGGPNDSTWIKFTESKFEYVVGSTNYGFAPYANNKSMGSDWNHYLVVKKGSTISLFQNGGQLATKTYGDEQNIVASLPVFLGGDGTNERWTGSLDNVEIYNHAIDTSIASMIDNGYLTPKAVAVPAGGRTLPYANESGTLNTNIWTLVKRGLETNDGAQYTAELLGDGSLKLSGTCSMNYWDGLGVMTNETFTASPEEPFTFTINRIAANGTGTGYRSSLWFINSENQGQYIHFAENSELNGGNWAFNYNNTAGGTVTNAPINWGQAEVSMTHDGEYVKMYVDGKMYASQPVEFNSFKAFVSTMTRITGDTVETQFSVPVVSTRSYNSLYDSFNDASELSTKWTSLAKGLENSGGTYDIGADHISVANGVLTLTGNCDNLEYWHGYTVKSNQGYTMTESMDFSVDREAVFSTGGGNAFRTSLWIWANNENWISFGQLVDNDSSIPGWQYNYSNAGAGVLTGPGIRFNTANDEVASITDTGLHYIKMSVSPLDEDGIGVLVKMYVDDIFAGEQELPSWDTNWEAYMMLTGSPRSGETITAVFDNASVAVMEAASVPEPSTWAMLILGLAGIMYYRRKK